MTKINVTSEGNVLCLAEHTGKLYVACGGFNKIRVFTSTMPFSRFEDIDVQGLEDPRDIAVCEKTSQLYIADITQYTVWRVNLVSYKQIDKFIVMQWQPRNLGVRSSRLLITPCDGAA